MKKLTAPQQLMLDTIRANGGTLRRVNFRFVDSAGKEILGLNLIAARSLVALRVVTTKVEGEVRVFTLA